MIPSRLLCLALALNVLLEMSGGFVDIAIGSDRLTNDSAPVTPLSEETVDAFEFDTEFDDLALSGITVAEVSADNCRGEILSERRLRLSPLNARTSLAPRAPPVC
jgi:hypothetical protein